MTRNPRVLDENLGNLSGVQTPETLVQKLGHRFGRLTPADLHDILTPVYFPIKSISSNQYKASSSTYAVKIEVDGGRRYTSLEKGKTGAIVPQAFVEDDHPWREIGKCRIYKTYDEYSVGELYSRTGNLSDLDSVLDIVTEDDYIEIDPFGIAGKLKSALTEQALANILQSNGFEVSKQPDNIANHIEEEDPQYDFLVKQGTTERKVEVKSLWGTNLDKARLNHSNNSEGYVTESIRFDTQDIIAVNMWLRTGNIFDFAFAISEYEENHDHGLPCAETNGEEIEEQANQNPELEIGDGRWFDDFNHVWELTL